MSQIIIFAEAFGVEIITAILILLFTKIVILFFAPFTCIIHLGSHVLLLQGTRRLLHTNQATYGKCAEDKIARLILLLLFFNLRTMT